MSLDHTHLARLVKAGVPIYACELREEVEPHLRSITLGVPYVSRAGNEPAKLGFTRRVCYTAHAVEHLLADLED